MTDEDVSSDNDLTRYNTNMRLPKEETWASNANVFVAQEDDVTQSYSVRVAGFDLLSVGMLSSSLFRTHGDTS